MCGILGFTGHASENDARRMLDTLRHRGPDDDGFAITPEIILGFARLSIIDTTLGSHQPMWSRDKKVCIVFNGEIYNFRELREELQKKGYEFKTTGDTEVIVNAYLEFGEKCFEKLEGMFGIGIYDFGKNKLILARDRLGKKPLYYFHQEGTFCFASELKTLAAHPQFKKKVDVESLRLYLFYDYVPTPRTMYENAHKLEPGSYLVYEGQKTHITKFWTLNPKPFTGTFDEAKAELDLLLEKSVKDRLVADVPLGVFLSGGIDSTTIAYYASKNTSEKIKTFSIGFEEKTFDESEQSKMAAEYLRTEHYSKIMKTEDLFEVMEDIGRLVDEPTADSSIIPTFLLSKYTKERVTVVLGGDGADELFAGYPTFIAAKGYGFYEKLPNFFKTTFQKSLKFLPVLHTYFNIFFMLRKFTDASGENLAHAHQMWLCSFTRDEQDKILITKGKRNEFDHIDRFMTEAAGLSEKNKILYTYLRSYLLDEVMVKVDRTSMFASLEARSPFLDHKLVEFAYSLPYAWKLKGLTTKYIVKKLMEDKLPQGIVYRKKKGFGMPIGRWFKHELREKLNEVLSEENVKKGGFFKYDEVKRLKEEHFAGKADHRKKLWNLFVFESWRQSNCI